MIVARLLLFQLLISISASAQALPGNAHLLFDKSECIESEIENAPVWLNPAFPGTALLEPEADGYFITRSAAIVKHLTIPSDFEVRTPSLGDINGVTLMPRWHFCHGIWKGHTIETIKGRVVAYANGLTCLNENAYWSMLIQVEGKGKNATASFLQVQFSLPCTETPQWLNRKSQVQEFRLEREERADSVLEEFLNCAPDSTKKFPQIPIWTLAAGVRGKKLPFGKVVPSYRSLDLPRIPIV